LFQFFGLHAKPLASAVTIEFLVLIELFNAMDLCSDCFATLVI
jgi:hypothetical protein